MYNIIAQLSISEQIEIHTIILESLNKVLELLSIAGIIIAMINEWNKY